MILDLQLPLGASAMADLIIGHTTHEDARIWIRGSSRQRWAQISLERCDGRHDPGAIDSGPIKLRPDDDFTHVASFSGLKAKTRYEVSARFARRRGDLDGDEAEARMGGFLTFPRPEADEPFSFLLGSCNLSTASLTDLGGLVAGFVGTLAGAESLKRSPGGEQTGMIAALVRLARRVGDKLLWLAFAAVYRTTRYEQPEPLLPSPFEALEALVKKGDDRPAFMIHAGDQIYFDFPFPSRKPDPDEYRRTYRRAWTLDPRLREFFAWCPHWMILDDHEIVNGFANDGPGKYAPKEYLEPALHVYREYVHARHPDGADGPLYYRFRHGATHFFVLDTRSGRFLGNQEMIDAEQMKNLKDWLRKYRNDLKFVVTSVPFVAQVRPDRERAAAPANGDEPPDHGLDEQADKWSGPSFRAQREEIIEFVWRLGIERLVFLAGDMHCAYHATMRVGRPERRVTLHEIAGGPIYQLQFSRRHQFYDQYRSTTRGPARLPYATWLRRYHGASSSVMRVTVSPKAPSQVRWEAVRTSRALPFPDDSTCNGSTGLRTLSGRISFPGESAWLAPSTRSSSARASRAPSRPVG
jgi:hypothetical protein